MNDKSPSEAMKDLHGYNPLEDDEPTWLDKRRASQPLRVMPEFSREDMSDVDDSKLVADVAFNRHSMNDGEHVSPSDNGMIQVGRDGVRVSLVQPIDEAMLKKTLSAAVRATVGLDMTQTLPGDWEHCQAFCDWIKSKQKGGHDYQAYFMPELSCDHMDHKYKESFQGESHYQGQVDMGDWEEMLKGGLQTALETQVIVFAVGGVSRTCTHQLVRTRKAAFHQQSQRAGYMGDAPECRMPESVWKIPAARNTFFRSVMQSWRAYREICDMDVSYQDARFVLPEGTTNFILLEYPIREFLNVYAYRGCSMFQWEIVEVMRQCRDALVEAHPWMEPYVKISCEKTGPATFFETIRVGNHEESEGKTVEHHCTFQGWEDVEGQCDFPWAKHEARTFKPEFHRITKKGGES